jgi:hypothetical protein
LSKHFIMTTQLLLPHKYKLPGWCILIPATIMGIILSITGFEADWLHTKVFALIHDSFLGKSQFFTVIHTNVTNTVVGVLFLLGAILVGFSREKTEDEYIARIRLSSLLWAVYVNYILLLLSFIFIYGGAFLTVMIYNMFTVMIIFIARFNFILFKNKSSASYEK